MTTVCNEYHLDHGLVNVTKATESQLTRYYQALEDSLEAMRQQPETPESWFKLLDRYKEQADRRRSSFKSLLPWKRSAASV